VARFLGGNVLLVSDSSLRAGHLRVLLGTSYAGPDAQPVAAVSTSPSNIPAPITAAADNCVN